MSDIHPRARWYAGFRHGKPALLFKTELDVNANAEHIRYLTQATFCYGPASLRECAEYAELLTGKFPGLRKELIY